MIYGACVMTCVESPIPILVIICLKKSPTGLLVHHGLNDDGNNIWACTIPYPGKQSKCTWPSPPSCCYITYTKPSLPCLLCFLYHAAVYSDGLDIEWLDHQHAAILLSFALWQGLWEYYSPFTLRKHLVSLKTCVLFTVRPCAVCQQVRTVNQEAVLVWYTSLGE
jgi:hypothetical protein